MLNKLTPSHELVASLRLRFTAPGIVLRKDLVRTPAVKLEAPPPVTDAPKTCKTICRLSAKATFPY